MDAQELVGRASSAALEGCRHQMHHVLPRCVGCAHCRHISNMEFANATPLHTLSMKYWDQARTANHTFAAGWGGGSVRQGSRFVICTGGRGVGSGVAAWVLSCSAELLGTPCVSGADLTVYTRVDYQQRCLLAHQESTSLLKSPAGGHNYIRCTLLPLPIRLAL